MSNIMIIIDEVFLIKDDDPNNYHNISLKISAQRLHIPKNFTKKLYSQVFWPSEFK
jgi:hypothetical protein